MYQDRHLSIDRQAQQILARDRLIRQLSVLALALSAIVFILAIMLLAVTRVYASEGCLSKAEARSKWPTQHIWFHTSERCWDNHAGRGRHYGKRNPEQAKPHPAPPARAEANAYVTENEFNALDAQADKPQEFYPTLMPVSEPPAALMLNPVASTQWQSITDPDVMVMFMPWEYRAAGAFAR